MAALLSQINCVWSKDFWAESRYCDADQRCSHSLDEFFQELSYSFGPFRAGKRSAFVRPIYRRVEGDAWFNVWVTNSDNLGPM
jgi:hypothetical protein